MVDILGPGNTDNAVTVRPARSITRGSDDTWNQNCSSPDANDGTALSADLLNDILAQMRTAIRSSGVTQDNADDMLWRAMQSLGLRYAADSGSASAIVATFSPPVTSLYAGLAVLVKANADPTGATTFTPNGLATKNLKWGDGTAIAAGDYKAGAILLKVYDGTQWQLLSTINRTAAGGGAGAFVPGCIYDWPTETVPDGTLECNGAAVDRTTYARLFEIIGTRYGVGNGTTTFNLPDRRGVVTRGWDHGAGVDLGAATRTVSGPSSGITGDHVGTKQAGAAGPVSITGGTVTITSPQFSSDQGTGTANLASGEGVKPYGWTNHNNTGNAMTQISGNASISGNSGAAETRMVNVSTMFVIAF